MSAFHLVAVNCPICNSNTYKQQYLVKQTWNIVQCNSCNFVYTNPRLDTNAIIDIYHQNYFQNTQFGYSNYEENPHLKVLNFSKWINEALPFLNTKNNLKALDVGCAAGFALSVYKKNNIEAHGIELDDAYTKNLKANNYLIYDKPLLENKYQTTYDMISMFDVIEHLTNLDQHATLLNQLLNQNGLLIFVTPDYNSLQRKVFGKRWFQFKPIEHINYFTKDTLQNFFEKFGFELVSSSKSGQFADAPFLIDRIQKYGAHPILKIFTMPIIAILKLTKKSFYIDAASIYCVFRKK
jgi:2-polyprenyl-3-methyl-5-hydroxy-6-metoxy-1,4-benzoquinol methylase